MTPTREQIREAKRILREDPQGNIMKRIEAVFVAEQILGENCSTGDVMKWAEEDDSEQGN